MEDEICPHCEKIITEEDKENYWFKQMKKTEKRLAEQKSGEQK